MGRPIKSEEQHWLDNSRPQTKASVQSHVPGGRPKFPSDLGNDPKLRRLFKDLCSLLQERRVLSKGDRDLIRLYCFVYDRHRRNVAMLRTEGEVVTYVRLDSNGQPHDQVKENIRVKICVAAEKQMASILSQLGLTPTAKDRARPTGGSTEKPAAKPGTVAFLIANPRPAPPPTIDPVLEADEGEDQ